MHPALSLPLYWLIPTGLGPHKHGNWSRDGLLALFSPVLGHKGHVINPFATVTGMCHVEGTFEGSLGGMRVSPSIWEGDSLFTLVPSSEPSNWHSMFVE